jgi:hypothetical protein
MTPAAQQPQREQHCEQEVEEYTVEIDQEGTVTIDAKPFAMIFPKDQFDDIILKVQQSRPHTPAPDTKMPDKVTLSIVEFELYVQEKKAEAARTATLKSRTDTIYELLKHFKFNCPGEQPTPICDLCGANMYCIELRQSTTAEKQENNNSSRREE